MPRRGRPARLFAAFFILSVAAFVINSLANDTTNSVITFVVILAGLPVYEIAFARRAR